jgi:DnaJ-class molecular chaperone
MPAGSCSVCGGAGFVVESQLLKCLACEGTGKIHKRICVCCDGLGEQQVAAKVLCLKCDGRRLEFAPTT